MQWEKNRNIHWQEQTNSFIHQIVTLFAAIRNVHNFLKMKLNENVLFGSIFTQAFFWGLCDIELKSLWEGPKPAVTN